MLQLLAQLLHKAGGGSAVDGPVVVGEGQGHGGVELDGAVGSLPGPLNGGAYAQDTGLGRVDNGGEALHAEAAQVGHGEAGPGELVRADGPVPGFCGQHLQLVGNLQQALFVGVHDGGHNQAPGGVHRHAQVYMVKLADAHVVQHVGVQVGPAGQHPGHSVENQITDGDAGALAARLLEHLPIGQDGGGVEGEVVGQLGHGGQGVVHGLADGPADAAELHVLILRTGSHSGGRGGCGGGGLSEDALGHQFTHIPLDNPAVGAGGGGQGAVHPGALGQVPGPGGNFSRARSGGGLNGRSSRRSGSSRGGGGLLRGGSGGRGRAVGPQGGHVLPLGADGAHVHQAGDLLAVAEKDLQQLAGGGGLTLEGSLVGLISKQDVALGDLVAHLLLPLADDTGFHCDARFGHQDCVCHDHSS